MNEENAKIIVVINQKGGVGKSTIAKLITGYCLHTMDPGEFMAVDMGSQLSLYNSIKRLDNPNYTNVCLPLITDNEDTLLNALEKPVSERKLILIDCNSNISKYEIALLLSLADLAIVPIVAQAFDIDATLHFSRFLDTAKDMGAKIRSVINKSDNTKESEVIRDFARNTLKIKPLDGSLPYRPAYYNRLSIYDQPNSDTINMMEQIKALLK